MEKVLSDVKCSLNVALAYFLRALNSFLNSYGYSLNHLVLGYNLNFPSVLKNGVTSSALIASHLNSLHAETKAEEKVLRAFKHKTRTTTSFFIEIVTKSITKILILDIGKVLRW